VSELPPENNYPPYRELLIGCGSRREKIITPDGSREWKALTTLDNNADHEPHLLIDLCQLPYELEDNLFDEIHAYEVLEHTGAQGDAAFFFAQFSEFWRILKPGGLFCATCPSYRSMWAWGDPSHTRILTSGTLAFLSQEEYIKQIGRTAMSDFRYMYKADFKIEFAQENDETLAFVLRAVKSHDRCVKCGGTLARGVQYPTTVFCPKCDGYPPGEEKL
jgi:hypothetical protein